MNKPAIAILFAVVAASAAIAKWADNFGPTQAVAIKIPIACDGECDALITFAAANKADAEHPAVWESQVRVKVDMKKMMETACLVDAGAKPSGLFNSVATRACEEKPAAAPAAKKEK